MWGGISTTKSGASPGGVCAPGVLERGGEGGRDVNLRKSASPGGARTCTRKPSEGRDKGKVHHLVVPVRQACLRREVREGRNKSEKHRMNLSGS